MPLEKIACGTSTTANLIETVNGLVDLNQLTTEQLINSSLTGFSVGDTIATIGFYSAGDDGGAQWKLTNVTGELSQYPHQVGDGVVYDASGRKWGMVANQITILATAFGLFPSDEDDSLSYFNAAFNYCKIKQRNLAVIEGVYRTSGTWSLYDFGGSYLIGAGLQQTILKPIDEFSGVLLDHRSTQAAEKKNVGGGVVGITLDGDNKNSVVFRSISVNHAVYKDMEVLDPSTGGIAFQMICHDARIGPDPADSQHCEISNIFARNLTGGKAISVDGNAGTASSLAANASLNYFQNIFCQIGGTADGFCFDFADGNTLNFLRVNQYIDGTGYGLVFSADDSGTKKHARQNICYSVQTAVSGVIAKAGDGTEPSFQNAIYGFNTGNAGINNSPIVEAGASLQWFDQTQAVFMSLNKGLSLGTGSYLLSSVDSADIIKNNEATASHTFFSRSGQHAEFISSTDASGDVWRMGFSEGGDFRVTRPRGSGSSFELSAPLKLTGQSITDGGASLEISINYKTYKIALTEVV